MYTVYVRMMHMQMEMQQHNAEMIKSMRHVIADMQEEEEKLQGIYSMHSHTAHVLYMYNFTLLVHWKIYTTPS